MTGQSPSIGVIGAGAWGTALAQSLALADKEVTLWAREQSVADAINKSQVNDLYLPTVQLSESIKASSDLSETLKNSDILLIVTPAQHVRATLKALKDKDIADKPIVLCSKGIEIETGLLLSQVATQELPDSTIAILTGPTFASEIGNGLPSAMTLAAETKDIARNIRDSLTTRHLRIYATDDVIGTQIGGAVKNVIAIACGIIDGLGFGESARAALVTRGLVEMSRLASAMGAKKETLTGMCGIGDLMLTCNSMQSRNFSLGHALGSGQTLETILAQRNSVTEGIHTAKALITLAKKNAIEMPISEAVNTCLSGQKSVSEVVDQMLERPLPDKSSN